jgi:hypothetical protein
MRIEHKNIAVLLFDLFTSPQTSERFFSESDFRSAAATEPAGLV